MNDLRHGRGEAGAAAVEFAIILPLLVLLVMGIVEFSRAYSAKEALQHAAREGARELAIHNDPSTITSVVQSAVVAPVDGSEVTVDISSDGVTWTAAGSASDPCPASPDYDDGAHVRATWDMDYNIPLFSSGTWTLQATGVMRCNG